MMIFHLTAAADEHCKEIDYTGLSLWLYELAVWQIFSSDGKSESPVEHAANYIAYFFAVTI